MDTSELTVHELRSRLQAFARDTAQRTPLVATIVSFGFKNGVPLDADLVFDARFLPNPHFVPALKPLTGRDRAVVRFMERYAVTQEFVDKLSELLRFLVPHYVNEGKSYLTIAVGCTGGRHRSVMLAERLRAIVGQLEGARARVRHRDMEEDRGVMRSARRTRMHGGGGLQASGCGPCLGLKAPRISHDRRRGRDARAARDGARERGGDDRGRSAAVRGRLDRLARHGGARARGDRRRRWHAWTAGTG